MSHGALYLKQNIEDCYNEGRYPSCASQRGREEKKCLNEEVKLFRNLIVLSFFVYCFFLKKKKICVCMCGVSRNIQQVFLRYLMMYHGQKDQLTALSESSALT